MNIDCPVRAIDLPGVPDLELRGLIVVVGPNSSGKTQLLHDIDEAVCGRSHRLVVASAVAFREPPPFDEYLEFLVERGTIRKSKENEFQKQSLQYGADAGGGSFRKSRIESDYQQFKTAAQGKTEGSLPGYVFVSALGPLSCSALFLNNRLTLMDACPTFDHRKQGPSKTLQSLYRNREAKPALHEEGARVFQCAVWVDNTRHAELVLRVSDSVGLPSPEDRLEPEAMDRYRTIETEGDGLRSYMAICATLLLETRPLCLVDEPEMCLHPPQAYAIGRFIGTHASEETCTVVATHSSHVLRGILETSPRAHVIRLTHVDSAFRGRTLTPDLLKKATSKPRSRSEVVLEGLLSHAVVLCEAETDRLVYESTYRTFQDRRLDLRFVPCQGTGGFVDPLRLYSALEVPTAVIADLDFLAKDRELKRVLVGLGVCGDDAKGLCDRARCAVSQIRSCLPQMTFGDVQAKLKALAHTPFDFASSGDAKLRGELSGIVRMLYRLHHLQQRGLEAIPETVTMPDSSVFLRIELNTLLSDLQSHGVFLVPVGELESWLPVQMRGHSREDKSRWAMLAAEKIEDIGERHGDVWEFIKAVYEFLEKRQRRLPTTPAQ